MIVGSAVVGREKEQIVSISDFLIQEVEKVSHLSVEFHEDIVVFLSASAVGVSYGVSGRNADS